MHYANLRIFFFKLFGNFSGFVYGANIGWVDMGDRAMTSFPS